MTSDLIPFEGLEARRLLTFSSSLVGNVATFTVGSALDRVTFTQTSSGVEEHSSLTAPAGQSFADNFDFDSTMPGSQHLPAGATINVGGGGYAANIGTDASPASGVQETFNFIGDVSSSVTIDNAKAGGGQYDLTDSSFVGNGVNVHFNGVALGEGLLLNLGTSGGVVNVHSTKYGQDTTIIGSSSHLNLGDGTVDLRSTILSSVYLVPVSSAPNVVTIKPLTTSGSTATISPTSITGLTGLNTSIGYGSGDVVNVVGGNGGNDFTISNTSTVATSISTGTGTNITTILSTSSPFTLTGQGIDTINVGNSGSTAGLKQPITIAGSGTSTAVTVDGSVDTAVANPVLTAANASSATLTGLTPAPISLPSGATDTWTIEAGTNASTFTLDFSGGDFFPDNRTRITTGGGTSLIVQGQSPGGPFTTEGYTNAVTSPGSAVDVNFDDSPVTIGGLKAIIDSAPTATFGYGYDGLQSLHASVEPGIPILGQPTTLVIPDDSPALILPITFTNKTNSSIGSGGSDLIATVLGSAVPKGATLTVDGTGLQMSANSLTYDAGGQTVTVTESNGPYGEIANPLYGTVDYRNMSRVALVNGQAIGPPTPPPIPKVVSPINGSIGVPLANVPVADFLDYNVYLTFVVTINWADGTTSAGTVTADPTVPALFHVTGSHTYTSERKNSLITVNVAATSTQQNYNGALIPAPSTSSAVLTTAVNITAPTTPSIPSPDFDGDGKADPTVYGLIPGSKLYGFTTLTSTSGFTKSTTWDNQGFGFGNASSIPVVGDFFGDGRNDYAIWSPDGHGYMILQVISSVDPTKTLSIDFGLTSDVPVVADVDGDGKDDFGVFGYDPNLGYRYDFLLSSKGFDPKQPLIFNNYGYGYGTPNATPVVANFDGSSHAGLGVYIPSGSTGTFTYTSFAIPTGTTGPIVNPPATDYFARTYGFATDDVMAVDYDGDGKADLAFYGLDPRTGRYRYDILTSSTNFSTTQDLYFDNAGLGYGYSASIPVMADYEGNGHFDFAVFQPDGSGGASFAVEDIGVGHGVVFDDFIPTDLPVDAPEYLLAKKVRGH